MTKYEISLAENYGRDEPFITEWDYEMIGDRLREEFDTYFAEQEELAGAGKGTTKGLFRGEYIKKFMTSKRINLVDDPTNGSLKSVFILRVGDTKLIDGRAKSSLAPRFEYKIRKDSEGKKLSPVGFIKFKLIEGKEVGGTERPKEIKVAGEDLDFFAEEEETPETENEEVFVCEVCEKEFDNYRALNAHMLSHRNKGGSDDK